MPIVKKCVCGKRFKTFPCKIKERKGIFCSRKCHYQNASRPSGLEYEIKVKNRGWFKKGHKPLNTIKKGQRLSPKTEFQKGTIPFTKIHPECLPRESHHHAWKGNKVGYAALHDWVYSRLGKPTKCTFCNKLKTTIKSMHWANKSRKYKREANDWMPLCASCHKLYDRKK